MKRNYLEILLVAAVVLVTAFLTRKTVISTFFNIGVKQKCIVCVDAGHGGNDPGKIGVNELKEKDINLSIAKKVRVILEQNDVEVVMTRTEDTGLYDEESKNKKLQDMKKRCELINHSNCSFTVSIHQNSFQTKEAKGAQVFYYDKSKKGKALAAVLQNQLREGLDKNNSRSEKANNNYYLLLHTDAPTVIVECGFLSNPEEADKLGEEKYQEKVAWQIALGIMKYLNRREDVIY